MAITTQVTQYATYSDSNSHLDSCLNGGTDYRTISGNAKNVLGGVLAGAGYCGNNISKACVITEVKVEMQCRTRTTSNGVTPLKSDCDYTFYLLTDSGVSGNKLNAPLTGAILSTFSKTISESSNWQKVEKTITITSGNPPANELRPAIKLVFWNGNFVTVRSYVKNLKFTVTRTRACYITFKGDGVTEKKTMYDYNTVPSYGSTPTRSGYTFKGWSNGSKTYSGTLPTAYEQDVTYTAVWEKNKVSCTITYNGNGATSGSVAAQSGYVGEALTLSQNKFAKSYNVKLYTLENEYFGAPYSEATFQGWYTSASGGTKVGDGGASYTPSGDVTLYARWSAMPAVTLPTPNRDGYNFLGWYTSAEGGTKVGEGGGNYTPTGNVTLYAQWKLDKTNKLYVGTSQPKSIFVGNQEVKAVYVGTTKIYG